MADEDKEEGDDVQQVGKGLNLTKDVNEAKALQEYALEKYGDSTTRQDAIRSGLLDLRMPIGWTTERGSIHWTKCKQVWEKDPGKPGAFRYLHMLCCTLQAKDKSPCPWFHNADLGSSTTPIRRHVLSDAHWDENHDQMRHELVEASRERETNQLSIRQGFKGGRSDEATRLIVEFMVMTNQPLRLVEQEVWRNMTTFMDATLTLPMTAETLKSKILDHEAEYQKWMQNLVC